MVKYVAVSVRIKKPRVVKSFMTRSAAQKWRTSQYKKQKKVKESKKKRYAIVSSRGVVGPSSY